MNQMVGQAEFGSDLRYRPPGAHRGNRLQLERVRNARRFLPLSTINSSRLLSLSEVSTQTGQAQIAVHGICVWQCWWRAGERRLHRCASAAARHGRQIVPSGSGYTAFMTD